MRFTFPSAVTVVPLAVLVLTVRAQSEVVIQSETLHSEGSQKEPVPRKSEPSAGAHDVVNATTGAW